jgi:hypothetical protein
MFAVLVVVAVVAGAIYEFWVQVGVAITEARSAAAPIAWNSLVFIGDAGGDKKSVKGRTSYALDAKTGKIVRESWCPRAHWLAHWLRRRTP